MLSNHFTKKFTNVNQSIEKNVIYGAFIEQKCIRDETAALVHQTKLYLLWCTSLHKINSSEFNRVPFS